MVTIKQNTTVVDVAFNLSGSLTGLPAIVEQLPVGERVGFDNLPEMWQDVQDIGQTWTPDLQGLTLDLTVPIYDTLGREKAPYSTNLYEIQRAVSDGEIYLKLLLNGTIRACDVKLGMNLRGCTLYVNVTPGASYNFVRKDMWLRTVEGWNIINQQSFPTSFIISTGTELNNPSYRQLYNSSTGVFWPVTEVRMQDDKDLIVGENTLEDLRPSASFFSWGDAFFKFPNT